MNSSKVRVRLEDVVGRLNELVDDCVLMKKELIEALDRLYRLEEKSKREQ